MLTFFRSCQVADVTSAFVQLRCHEMRAAAVATDAAPRDSQLQSGRSHRVSRDGPHRAAIGVSVLGVNAFNCMNICFPIFFVALLSRASLKWKNLSRLCEVPSTSYFALTFFETIIIQDTQ